MTEVDRLEALTRDYRIALLRYLPRADEAALTAGYEWGRAAIGDAVSLLDVVRVHHDVLREILVETPADEIAAVTDAASAFLTEVVAPYDMTRQGLLEANRDRASAQLRVERQDGDATGTEA